MVPCLNRNPPKMKLLVDRANKTFKVVARLDLLYEETPWTAVYDSTTGCWTSFLFLPGLLSFRYFVWENVVYAYNAEEKRLRRDKFVSPFDMEQRRWTSINAEFLSEFSFPTNRFILSDNNQAMLVLFSNKKRKQPYFSVWKLSDGGSRFAQPNLLFERENWEKVAVSPIRRTVDLADHHLTRASYRAGHICFVFRDYRIKHYCSKDDGSSVHKFVRYSFATESWSLMPCPGDLARENFELYNWEPAPDMDLGKTNQQLGLKDSGCLVTCRCGRR